MVKNKVSNIINRPFHQRENRVTEFSGQYNCSIYTCTPIFPTLSPHQPVDTKRMFYSRKVLLPPPPWRRLDSFFFFFNKVDPWISRLFSTKIFVFTWISRKKKIPRYTKNPDFFYENVSPVWISREKIAKQPMEFQNSMERVNSW